QSLYDRTGTRKYLVSSERRAFIHAALRQSPLIANFCVTLALTGARISEVLALTGERIDVTNCSIVIRTLKRRNKFLFRAVPVPQWLIDKLRETQLADERDQLFGAGHKWRRCFGVLKSRPE
ncbi:MAG TPA: hypothetical protein VMD53_08210, partial [Rhizomicrobium sp.]|nr:hypothetical protein [Rhizomicrobium sp.]